MYDRDESASHPLTLQEGVPQVCGMAMFDELVRANPLMVCRETLHALLYMYELAFIHRGVSVASLSAENTLERSIFSEPCTVKNRSFLNPSRMIYAISVIH